MKKFFVATQRRSILNRRKFRVLKTFAEITNKPENASDILVISGDGGMLSAIHDYRLLGLPFCGLNIGHTGFLMNEPDSKIISEIANGKTVSVSVRLLKAFVSSKNGEAFIFSAFNDFYFERTSPQTANIKVTVENKVLFNPLICD